MATMTLRTVEVGGKVVSWQALIEAAVQDTVGSLRLASGHLACPNGAADLGSAYRRLIATLLPDVAARRDAAYRDYCRGGAATARGPIHAIGHGSWASGPSPERQGNWQAWERLLARLRAAVDGRYVPAEPCGV